MSLNNGFPLSLVLGSAMILLGGLQNAALAQTATIKADTGLAGVALLDPGAEVIGQELGESPCVMTNSAEDTASYWFRTADGGQVQFITNTASYHVHRGLIDTIVLRADPILPTACAKAVPAAASKAPLPLAKTGQGIALGDSIEQVEKVYGSPAKKSQQDATTRLTYIMDLGDGQHYEWTCTFKHDRLVEWAARVAPVFFEMGG